MRNPLKIPAQTPKKADFAAVAGVLLLAAALVVGLAIHGRQAGAAQVVVYLDGTQVFSGELDTDAQYEAQGQYSNLVTIRDGKAWIETADCPGEDCVRQGSISRAGQSIVCLPNHLVVAIEGHSDVDVVVR